MIATRESSILSTAGRAGGECASVRRPPRSRLPARQGRCSEAWRRPGRSLSRRSGTGRGQCRPWRCSARSACSASASCSSASLPPRNDRHRGDQLGVRSSLL